jgi:glucosyl-3-phosphoglycerate synthase
VRISVCLPARNEAATIGAIVHAVLESDFADEIVVIDDGSTDETAAVARSAGARVVTEREVLPEAGAGSGKGNVLWKSLYECRGDVICWLDADLRNFRAESVVRLVEPLLANPDVAFVKAYYKRSFEGAPTGGGRVTELVARPLLSLLFPKLADIVQPLGGEYAARRSALEVVSFVEGWGVELALLVDIVERFGRDAVTQVDLGARVHRNRPLDQLVPQARAILATAMQRAELFESAEVVERPPMITVPAYQARRAQPR